MTKSKTNLKDTKRGAFYWDHENKPYISVTNVLKIIDKPALRYWFGKEVYLAMLKDPTMNEQEALSAPYKKTDSAITRGLTVHSIVESYKHTKEQLDVVEEYRGYAQAFYKFIESTQAKILEQEKTVFNLEMRYGGTLDLLLQLYDEDKPFVIDVKTGKDIYVESFLQTSAYAKAIDQEVGGIGTLLLKEDGSYKFAVERDIDTYFEGFKHALGLWRVMNLELIDKVGLNISKQEQ